MLRQSRMTSGYALCTGLVCRRVVSVGLHLCCCPGCRQMLAFSLGIVGIYVLKVFSAVPWEEQLQLCIAYAYNVLDAGVAWCAHNSQSEPPARCCHLNLNACCQDPVAVASMQPLCPWPDAPTPSAWVQVRAACHIPPAVATAAAVQPPPHAFTTRVELH